MKVPASNIELWLAARRGRFTSSQLSRLMAEPRSKTALISKGAQTYVEEVAAEAITGRSPHFETAATEWGNDHEVEAVELFSFDRGLNITQYGSEQVFIEYGEYFGGTPDGMVERNAVLEVKCPYNQVYHLKYLQLKDQFDLKKLKPEYYWQCLGNCLITQTETAYFVSYHPHFPTGLALCSIKVHLTNELAELIEEKINKAGNYLNQIMEGFEIYRNG